MEDYGGFEGNAQTMRLLTKRLFTEQSGRTDMKPTRALMDAVCKYKEFWKQDMQNHFLYTDQRDCAEFIHDSLSASQQSIECQVMDWSDDIANAYADINDGVKARLINVPSLEQWAASQTLDSQDDKGVRELLESIKKADTERFRSRGIGECITATAVVSRSNPLASRTWRYSHGIEIRRETKKRCKLMKNIARGIVIQSALVQQLEMKTHRMLDDLFKLLLDTDQPSCAFSHRFGSSLHQRATVSVQDQRGERIRPADFRSSARPLQSGSDTTGTIPATAPA
jgi:dGTPase